MRARLVRTAEDGQAALDRLMARASAHRPNQLSARQRQGGDRARRGWWRAAILLPASRPEISTAATSEEILDPPLSTRFSLQARRSSW